VTVMPDILHDFPIKAAGRVFRGVSTP